MLMKMGTKRITRSKVAGIILYVLSVLTLLYFFYATYVSISYIGSLMAQGQITFGKNLGEIIQYIMTNAFSYLFYTVCFAFFGFVVQKFSKEKQDIPTLTEE